MHDLSLSRLATLATGVSMISENGIRSLCFIDTETSDVDIATGKLLEVGFALWSIPHRNLLWARSALIEQDLDSNPAFHVNGIEPSILKQGIPRKVVSRILTDLSPHVIFVAHFADFERRWLPEIANATWICSCDDLQYPKPVASRALTSVALSHGVGVASAHRTIDDVLMLVRLFERVAEIFDAVAYQGFERWLARGLRPKMLFDVADRDYDEKRNLLVKQHGFRWNPMVRSWQRKMVPEDTKELPFAVVPADG